MAYKITVMNFDERTATRWLFTSHFTRLELM